MAVEVVPPEEHESEVEHEKIDCDKRNNIEQYRKFLFVITLSPQVQSIPKKFM